MAKKISASVGKGGKNKPEDTQVVQELLNAFTKQGGFKKLDTDGVVGPKTISAIAAFQKEVVGMARVDSRVDPNGDTMSALAMGPKKVEAEAKKAEQAEAKEAAKKEEASSKDAKGKAGGAGAKPQVKGDTSGLDKRLLAVLEAVSAHYGKPILIEKGKVRATGGGKEVWDTWESALDRGNKYGNLKRNKSLREQLDGLYNDLNKDGFLALLAKNSRDLTSEADSAHSTGRAVDLKRGADSKVVAALATVLRREDEGDAIHFDDGGKSLPKEITDAMKQKWK